MIIMIHNDKVMIMIIIYPETGDRNFDQDLDHHLSLQTQKNLVATRRRYTHVSPRPPPSKRPTTRV